MTKKQKLLPRPFANGFCTRTARADMDPERPEGWRYVEYGHRGARNAVSQQGVSRVLLVSTPLFDLTYTPQDKRFRAGCRSFTRKQALEHWLRVLSIYCNRMYYPEWWKLTSWEKSRMERAELFYIAIKSFDPEEIQFTWLNDKNRVEA